jgi:hypothetical protein
MSLPGHFAETRAAYAELLKLIRPEEYASAASILQYPLGQELYYAYTDLHVRAGPYEGSLVEFMGNHFVYDPNEARVVGAIGCSQEQLNLVRLLGRLREQQGSEDLINKTVVLIGFLLRAQTDATSLQGQLAIHHAVATALGIQGRGLMRIFDDISLKSNYRDRLSHIAAKRLRALSKLVHDRARVDVTIAPPKRGEPLSDTFWGALRSAVSIADRELPDDEKSEFVERLACFYQGVTSELLDELRKPTEQLLERVATYVCPLVDTGDGRLRNRSAQQWRRLRGATEHPYDIGHFLPHSAGGPNDINFFIQERNLNRGWSASGKRYRWFENLVVSRPGTFYFVRPVYEDLSPIPRYLEWGVLLESGTAEKLASSINEMSDSFLMEDSSRSSNFVWLLSVFENFPIESHKKLVKAAVVEIPDE